MQKRRGFTLIELLVVIAIIGILAAMLFPVFARARESARKTQCLANVKNLAMAMQLYLTDYDMFPPHEHRAEVVSYFHDTLGCGSCCRREEEANPYLRWPVILDEYTKNRDIWKCPSARNICTVMLVNPDPDWFRGYKKAMEKGWPCVCEGVYPNGWGGTQTEYVTDDGCPAFAGTDTKAVELDLFMADFVSREVKMSQVQDATKYIVVAERGVKPKWWRIEQIAYPELCRISWGENLSDPGGNCSLKDGCEEYDGVCGIHYSKIEKFWTDPSMRKPFARHMGGNNLGFADGHAKWMDADAMLAAAGNWKNPNPGLEGINCQCLPNAWSS